MELLQNLPPIVAIVLGFLLLVWLVLVLLVPFMIEGIRTSTRRTHEELAEMNEKLDRLNAQLTQLAQRSASPAHGGGREGTAVAPRTTDAGPTRGRREPTISDTPVGGGGSRQRREPTVR